MNRQQWAVVSLACLSLLLLAPFGMSWPEFTLTRILPYLVPTFIALGRRHPKRVAISLVNVLLGWTLVGWVVALVWSLKSTNPAPQADGETTKPAA